MPNGLRRGLVLAHNRLQSAVRVPQGLSPQHRCPRTPRRRCTLTSLCQETNLQRTARRSRKDMPDNVSVCARLRVFSLTIRAMPIACTAAARAVSMANAPQPASRLCLPPANSIANAAMVMPSMTTANDIRKPTDLHMLQKYLFSPWQSSSLGNSTHSREEVTRNESSGGNFVFEHLRWRPYV